MEDKQIALRPHDVVVLFKLILAKDYSYTYAELASQLKLSASQVHASVRRTRQAKLVGSQEDKPMPLKASIREFLVHGAKYAFPAVLGSATRGMVTAYAASPLNSIIAASNELPPVWPDSEGSTRGLAFYPLYPNATFAAKQDPDLYELLALFDALRGGAAREREVASEMLQVRIA